MGNVSFFFENKASKQHQPTDGKKHHKTNAQQRKLPIGHIVNPIHTHNLFKFWTKVV